MTRPTGMAACTRRDLTGQRWPPDSRLVVVRLVEDLPRGRALWECVCDCGATKLARHESLMDGKTRSCGCLAVESSRENIELARSAQVEARKAFTEALAECLTRFPQTAGEIRQRLLDWWGCHGDRKFWRELRRLVRDGRAIREGVPGHGSYRAPRSEPRKIPQRPMVGWLAARAAAGRP